VVRWQLLDLMQWVFEEFRLSISKQTMSRELRSMAFRKLSARPRHHAHDEAALEGEDADGEGPGGGGEARLGRHVVVVVRSADLRQGGFRS